MLRIEFGILAFVLTAPISPLAAQSTVSLGLAAGFSEPQGKIQGDLCSFSVFESFQSIDLNGDGDQVDVLLHLHRLSSGVTTNTNIPQGATTSAQSLFSLGDRLCLAVASESRIGAGNGTDVNGDGDLNDDIPFVHDAATGVTVMLPIAASTAFLGPNGRPLTSGPHVVFAASESGQRADLNGDGDQSDIVLHRFSVGMSSAQNLGLAVNRIVVGRDHALFSVPELVQGVDLNGDGDLGDFIAHGLDLATGTPTNLAISTNQIDGDGDLFAFVAVESEQGADLNGDADLDDLVVHAWLAAAGTVRNLGSPANLPGFSDVRLDVQGYLIAWGASEVNQGTGIDWNADGDALDIVLHVHNARSGSTANAGLAVGRDLASIAIQGHVVAVFVSEAEQGGVSRNGDLDATDAVAALFDTRTQVATNLALATNHGAFDLSSELATFLCDEQLQGAGDLNGDGRIGLVVIAVRLASPSATVLTGALFQPRVIGRRVVYSGREADAGQDLNGDGDEVDHVLLAWDSATTLTANLGLAVTGSFAANGRAASFAVLESQQGATDQNGDGDITDRILHVLLP